MIRVLPVMNDGHQPQIGGHDPGADLLTRLAGREIGMMSCGRSARGTISAHDGQGPLGWAGRCRLGRTGARVRSAADVPGLIRGLRSGDQEQREKASWALYGNIFHQGSRYEATAYAIPFLLGLAADPGTPDRAGVVRMLGALAIGYDESYLPAGVDAEAWRREVARTHTADPAQVYREYDEWVAKATDDGERRAREFRRQTFDLDAARVVAESELAAYDAVRAGVPTLCALLGDPDPGVRAAAAWVLGWFPEESAYVLPRLLGLLDTETIPGVAANAIVAAGLLGDAALTDRLRALLAGDEPLPRWAAATALARLGVADPAVIAELAACGANPPEQGEPGVTFHEGDLRGYASASLALLDGKVPDEAVDSVLDGLPED